ncbi:hypothetical protein PABG_07208 [Paracoccidioides brasiliensis Pb03]|nr:hypothetical protein PABG_07208 [Paracoccidioides brasiliensis Pb03]
MPSSSGGASQLPVEEVVKSQTRSSHDLAMHLRNVPGKPLKRSNVTSMPTAPLPTALAAQLDLPHLRRIHPGRNPKPVPLRPRLRHRPAPLGPLLRAQGPPPAPAHRHLRLHRLPIRRRRVQGPANTPPLPLLRRLLRRLPAGRRRRRVLRHVRLHRPRPGHHHLLHAHLLGPAAGPHRRRLRRQQPPGLALDAAPPRDHGCHRPVPQRPLLHETYPPIILVEKAAELRRITRNWGIHAKQEEIEIDLRELIEKNFSRPLTILVTEPIMFLLSIYLAFIFGIIYLFMTAYPIVFQRIHGFAPGVAGLPLFGVIAGQLIAGATIILSQSWYLRKLEANRGIPVPEWRLPHLIVGGISFAGGLFWFGWSGYRADVHWIVPTLSGLMSGFGLLVIFVQSLNYIIDAYMLFAASAIAANTLLRSLAGAAFPLFAQRMFVSLGVNWAITLLGCVAIILAPIPVIFYFYGASIRARSKFFEQHTVADE